jgi:protein SCO1/2
MTHWNRVWQLVTALVLGVLALGACAGPYQFRNTTLEPPSAAADFTLTDHNGRPFTLSEQRGKVVVLFFGFTSCPDGVCPTALADLAAARRQLGDDAERVLVAMVTIDPDYDTTEGLGSYVTQFDPAFVGLRGEQAELDIINKAYGVTATRVEDANAPSGYNFIHSGYVYVIDKAGQWRALIRHGAPVEDVVSDLRYFARERV